MTLTELIAVIQSGEASPAHFAAARALLKDNNITGTPEDDKPLRNLARGLPFSS